MKTLVENLRIAARRAGKDADALAGKLAAVQLGVPPDAVRNVAFVSKSIDSRRGEPSLIYRLLLDVDDRFASRLVPAEDELLKSLAPAELQLPGSKLRRPIVVGTGPAGIFGALALALAGCRPLVIDRGTEVETRCADHERFLRTRELDEESNLLIGEGGAGTFSDGKLYTGTRDSRGRFVIDSLISAGAPPEIRYRARAHIGSDILRRTCAALRERIVGLGGEFRFRTRLHDLSATPGGGAALRIGDGETTDAPAVLLAPGLGGRELVYSLGVKYGGVEPKPFQIGCRIEHPQSLIDRNQYRGSRPECLGAAEYHLSSGGVSSFCMCPGGTLVNASAWNGHSCTNGMSLHARDGEFANAALIVTMRPEEFSAPDDARALAEAIETELFRRGGSDYTFPAQDAAAFIRGEPRLSRSESSSETGTVPGRLDDLLPRRVRDAVAGALRDFDRKIPGFIRHGVLVGVESCVSSPIRMSRNENGEWTALPKVFPAGEGVGAAGGIVSAACDGIRAAEAMLRTFPASGGLKSAADGLF